MALRISCSASFNFNFNFYFNFKSTSSSKFSASFPTPNSTFTTLRATLCRATNSHSHHNKPSSSSSSSSSATTKKKKKNKTNNNNNNDGGDSDTFNIVADFEIVQDFPAGVVDVRHENEAADYSSLRNPNSMALPEPPAGFILDDHANVVFASSDRLLTIVDPTNNLPLECVVRRVFRSSEGHECMLLCPVDTPVQILKSTNEDGWSAVSDKEVESILPAAAYALAKIHMHLVYSGYCYTARGGFCYTEEDIFDFNTDDGKEVDGLPTEGVEITYFNLEDTRYMIYTPSDPLLFVGVKDQNGMLQVADDELLEDPAIYDAIDEETEFNALAEEEAAFLDLTLSERL